jgi:hypothetical protein
MLWNRAKRNGETEVHVTNRAELDAALRSADRIVVEGDPGLTAYATRLAATGLQHATAPVPTLEGAGLRPVAAQERAAHVPTAARPPRLWPWIAGAAALAVGATAALLLEHFARAPTAMQPRLHTAPAATGTNLADLAWPAVAVVLIAALYLILRQAISSGRDVQIAWQVTEKVGGRVVITKVRARAA